MELLELKGSGGEKTQLQPLLQIDAVGRGFHEQSQALSQPPGNTWMWPQPPGIDFLAVKQPNWSTPCPAGRAGTEPAAPKTQTASSANGNPSRWSRQGDQTAKEPAGACLIPFVCFANCEVGLGLLFFFFSFP